MVVLFLSLSFELWKVLRTKQSCFYKRVFSFWKAVLCALCLERLSPTFLWRSSDFITPGMKTSFIPNWSNQSICHIITYLAASWPPDQPWDYLPDKIECFGWMLCYLISFRLRSFLCDCSEFITSGSYKLAWCVMQEILWDLFLESLPPTILVVSEPVFSFF